MLLPQMLLDPRILGRAMPTRRDARRFDPTRWTAMASLLPKASAAAQACRRPGAKRRAFEPIVPVARTRRGG